MATGLCGTCGGSTPGCGCHVTAGTGIAVTGDGSSGSPFVVTNTPVAGDGIAVSGSTISAKNRKQLANPVRNASFAVWQRGTSRTGAASYSTVGPDRWNIYRSGWAAGATWTQQVSGDSQGSGYCLRIQRDNANASADTIYTVHSCETKDSVHLANRTVTISFRARKGANYSAASSFLQMAAYSGTGTDQSVSAGFTGQVTVTNANYALTSSWVTYSVTVAIGSGVTQIGMIFAFTPVGTAGAADYCEVKDVRIDDGSYAQEHVPLPYALDLAECQRYYEVGGGYHAIWSGAVTSGSAYRFGQQFKVTKRAAPTVVATHLEASSFPTTDPTVDSASTTGFRVVKSANATASDGLYNFTWTASAEI